MRRVAVLVTGSRKWVDRRAVYAAVSDAIGAAWPAFCVLIHGDARGADALAGEFARDLGIQGIAMPAPWKALGKYAGPERNEAMVTVLLQLKYCGYECHVLAFPLPGSVGTHDCIRKARAAGFDVRVVEPGAAP